MITWKLTDQKINEIQVEDIDEVIKRAKQSHYVDIHIRINGKWEVFQADWIKYLTRDPWAKDHDGCHLSCCEEACEGEGCKICGPDV